MKERRLRLALALAVLAGCSGCSGIPAVVRSRDPLTVEEHRQLAAAYMLQDLPDLSEREFEAVLRRKQRDVFALVGMGNLHFAAGKLKSARKYYRRALRAQPGHAGASNNLAMIYLSERRRLDEAERLVLGSLETSGDLRPYLLDTLANIYILKGRREEAENALAEAKIKADPANHALQEHLEESWQKLEGPASPR